MKEREDRIALKNGLTISPKKRSAEEAKPKDPAVPYQTNHYLKELLT